MSAILVSNFCTLSLIIGLTYLLKTGELFSKKIERIFSAAILCVFTLTIADMTDYYLQSMDTFNPLRYVSSVAGYILRPLSLVIFISLLLRNRRNPFLLWVPLLIEMVIVISSPFNHWMFYFDQDNQFHRGPLGFTAHIISAFYDVLFIYIAVRMRRYTEFRETLMAIFVTIITSVATLLETGMGLKFILPGALIVSGTIYYIYLYEQIYKFDALTGLLNRRSFQTDVERLLDSNVAVVSIDLNNLKTINDTEGHAAGDMAIQTVASILREVGYESFNSYRIGGDEFIVLGLYQGEIQTNEFIEKVQVKLNKTNYTASFGKAFYTPNKNFEKVCEEADFDMYNNKQEMKQVSVEDITE